MNLLQAALYFLVESVVNLRRGWRTSVFAVLTIAVSLFVGGVFLLLGSNAGQLVSEWRGSARVILYLHEELEESRQREFRDELDAAAETESVALVSGSEAETRFRAFFPRMASVLDDTESIGLPPSLEVELSLEKAADRSAWLTPFEDDPRVASVDDDIDWLARIDRGLAAARAGAGFLWLVLAVGTMVTIASLVRLSTFAYREEIEVLRLVGATEFLIRGPFYMEGILQGLIGGIVALATLFLTHELVANRASAALGEALIGDFLSPGQCLILVLVGAGAGLAGALLSIPRESAGSESFEVG